MDAQLRLIPRPDATRSDHGADHPDDAPEAPAQWRIDDDARARGRAGISRARQALRQARHPLPRDRHTTAA